MTIMEELKNIQPPTEEEMKEAHDNYMNFLRENPNNFSNWFPKISVVDKYGVKIPKSRTIEVPEEIYSAFFLEKKGDKRQIRLWAHDKVLPVVRQVFPDKEVFMQNGCYSGKFCFDKCCHLPANATLAEIVDHLCRLQYDSLMLDTSGNLGVVLREWIKPQEGTKTIYGGMPLRAEMRLFYDFDHKKPLYWVNYWDWDYCHDPICENPEDKEVYEECYPYINEEIKLYAENHWKTINDALQKVQGMKGVWSIDFILEEQKVWLIDAAIATMSAYWDVEKAIKAIKGE